MPTNKQRRDANRVRLQRQLEARRESEDRRRKITLITSISVTVVLIAAIVITIVATTGGDDKSTQSQPGSGTTASATTASATTAPAGTAPVACAGPAAGATVTFKGVTVKNPTNLKKDPTTTSTSTAAPAALECQDLVVGKGKAATPTSTVKVQYAGVLYKNGKAFDSSWSRGGTPVSFPLTGVVPGFTQGIGGTGKVAPMKVGGRRILILPSSLGYGAQASGTIPANSSLVFVVDLTSVS